jgi:hypothetical protein
VHKSILDELMLGVKHTDHVRRDGSMIFISRRWIRTNDDQTEEPNLPFFWKEKPQTNKMS